MNRVLTFWSWNGNITERTIRRDINFFRSAGIGGFFIHARAGLTVEYMSCEWLRLVRYAAEYGHACGLDVYLYDENGWPSGFAFGKVPEKGEDYRQAYMLPLGVSRAEAERAGEKALACFERGGKSVTWVVRRNNYYSDLMNPKATDAFIEFTHERYYAAMPELFGCVIKGIFTDEPQLSTAGYPYSDVLPQAYFNEYGEDFFANLHLLTEDGTEADKFRFKYRSTVAALYERGFSAKIGEWCARHNILFTGHMAAEDGLYCQIQSQCSVMPCYRHFGMPGIDHLGLRKASPVLIRQAASAAEQCGKNLLSETFGGSGHGATFAEMLDTWFYQTALGVNTACLHLSAVSALGRRKRDYPPTFSYHRSDSERLSVFTNAVRTLAEYAAKPRRTDILVLNPISSYFERYAFGNVTEELSGISLRYRELLDALARLGYDCDVGDETLLADCGSANGGKITLGAKAYSALVIPECRTVRASTLAVIKEFILGGGKVFFCGKLPCSIEGEPTEEFRALYNSGKLVPLGLRDNILGKALEGNGVVPVFRVYAHRFRGAAAQLTVTVRGDDGERVVFLYNTCDGDRTVSFFMGGERAVKLRAGESVVLDEKKSRVYRPFAGAYEPLCEFVPPKDERAINCATAKRLDSNALVLDRAEIECEGRKYSGEVISLTEKVYEDISAPAAVTVQYPFVSRGYCGNVRIAAETSAGLEKVTLNGREILPDGGYDYDEDFSTYAGRVRDGENEITLYYKISPACAPQKGAFETATNIYFYETEFENVTVLGDFDVSWQYERKANARGIYLVGDGFALVPAGAPAYAHNAPFYRGRYLVEQTFPDYNEDFTVTFDADFSVCEMRIGKKRVAAINNTFTLPAHTPKAEFVFYSLDRNRMGPHHYFGLDTEFVAPDTFLGNKGWSDMFNVKVAYACVPEDTRIREYVIKDERVRRCKSAQRSSAELV